MIENVVAAGRRLALLALCLLSSPAWALSFTLDEAGEWNAVLNTTITAGAAWRMEDRADDLVGKASLDPDVCGRTADGRSLYQACQGLFRTQVFPAQHLADAPGQFSTNADDGNLNYDKHDLVQAPLKITQDLTISRGDFGRSSRACTSTTSSTTTSPRTIPTSSRATTCSRSATSPRRERKRWRCRLA